MDQEGAEAPVVAASEAVASEAADMAAVDTAAVDLAARMDREDRMAREALILDGALAHDTADGTADPTIMVAVAVLVVYLVF